LSPCSHNAQTVTHRVREFELTPSATLTLDQFSTVDIEHEADPPVYSRNKLLEARTQAIRENNVELLTSGALDDPQEGKKASRWREEPKFSSKEKQLSALYMTLEAELTSTLNDEEECVKSDLLTIDNSTVTENQLVVHQSAIEETSASSLVPAIRYPKKNGVVLTVLPTDATEEELQRPTQPTVEKFSLTAWKEKLPENAMEEMEMLFRDENEITEKEAIFDSINKEFLEQQKRKKDMKLDGENASKNGDGESKRKKFSVGRSEKEGEGMFPTTEQALLAALSTRKVSRKINYDAMSSIFDDDGSFSTELLRDKVVRSSEVDWDHL
jgi:transcription factor IIIB subunit 2